MFEILLSPPYLPAIFGLLGVVAGALISGAFLMLAQRQATHRQQILLAYKAAIAEYENAVILAGKVKGYTVSPFSNFLFKHLSLSAVLSGRRFLSAKEAAQMFAEIEHHVSLFEIDRSELREEKDVQYIQNEINRERRQAEGQP